MVCRDTRNKAVTRIITWTRTPMGWVGSTRGRDASYITINQRSVFLYLLQHSTPLVCRTVKAAKDEADRLHLINMLEKL